MRTKIYLLIVLALIAYHPAIAQTIAPPPSHGGEMKNVQSRYPSTGYLMAIDNPGERLKLIKTTDLVDVYALSEVQFPNNCIEWGKELQKSVFYQLESRNRCFYVEVKRINRNGKFRRMSNREFRVQSSEFKVQGYVGSN